MRLFLEVVDAVKKRDETALAQMCAEGVYLDEANHNAPFPTPACLIAFDADVEGLKILRKRCFLNENLVAYGFALGGHVELLKRHCQLFKVKKEFIVQGIFKTDRIDLIDRCIDELALPPAMIALYFAMDDNYLLAVHYQEKYAVDPQILFEGFARSGHLLNVLALRFYHPVKADLVIFNFAFGGYPVLAREFYEGLTEPEKSVIDLDRLMIRGLAFGGHTQHVEVLRETVIISVDEIAENYARGGFYEAAEAYRVSHDVPAEYIARGFAFGGWYSYAEHYHRELRVDRAVIEAGFREGGHNKLLEIFESQFKNTNKPYIPVARFFGSANPVKDGKAEAICEPCTLR